MVALGTLTAVLAFLLPVFAFVGLRLRSARRPWEIALDIPMAVALDLLLVLALARFMTLEKATIASRALYAAMTAGWLARDSWARRPRPRWPDALDRRHIVLLLVTTGVALAVSLEISRSYSIWDRHWHIPLVASLRGQALPFRNVYDPRQILHYHFAGDVEAAMLQTLSLTILHASLALSLAHDIQFALIGVTLGLFLIEWGYRRCWTFVLAALALLLTGPVTLLREGDFAPQNGYSIVNYLSLSCRPHTSLAGLFMLGFAGVVTVRLGGLETVSFRETTAPLVASAAGLSISDETSLGMLALALGVCWLFVPRCLHPKRSGGILVFAALAAALVVPNLVFAAALAPGAQHHVFSLVASRSPGCLTPELPLTTERGLRMLVFDMLAPAAVAMGIVAHAITRRGRGRLALAGYFVVLLGMSLFALTRFDVDGEASETHRFATAVVFLGPFLGLAVLARSSPPGSTPRGGELYAFALPVLGWACAAISTMTWYHEVLPALGQQHRHYFATFDHYDTNCRDEVGPSLGAEDRFVYVARPLWYLVAGCSPVFAPGVASTTEWKQLTIGVPRFERAAVAALRRQMPSGSPLAAVCPTAPDRYDVVCATAEATGPCRVLGRHAKECLLSAADVEALSVEEEEEAAGRSAM